MTITSIINVVTYPIAVGFRYLFWFLIYANWDKRMFYFCWDLFAYLYKLSPTWNYDTECRLYRRFSTRFFRALRYRYRLRDGFRLLQQLRTTLPITETVPVRELKAGREHIYMQSDTFYLYGLYNSFRVLKAPGNMSFLARGIALFYYGFATEYYAQYYRHSELHMCKVEDATRALNKLFNLDQKFRKYFKK